MHVDEEGLFYTVIQGSRPLSLCSSANSQGFGIFHCILSTQPADERKWGTWELWWGPKKNGESCRVKVGSRLCNFCPYFIGKYYLQAYLAAREPRNIVLKCAKWNEKDKYFMISLICEIYKNKKVKLRETE